MVKVFVRRVTLRQRLENERKVLGHVSEAADGLQLLNGLELVNGG